MLQAQGQARIALSSLPIASRQTRESEQQCREHEDEAEVRAQRTDEEDGHQETHVEVKEGERGEELGVVRRRCRVSRIEGDGGVVERGQRDPVCEPEGAEAAKNDEGERVA